MPGRGNYWKKGGLVDETVTQDEIDPTYRTTIEGGGGGAGLQYATISSQTIDFNKDLMFSDATYDGETGNTIAQTPMIASGKVTKIHVRVYAQSASTTSSLTLHRNGSQVGSALTWDDGDIGSIVTLTEDKTWSAGDLVMWEYTSGGGASAQYGITAEIDWS